MSGWVADSKGIHAGGWGLTLSAKDMLKLGQLYLNDGYFNGQPIVSSDWVKQSTTEHSRWDKIGKGFGYLWWLDDEKCFAAMGDSGNIIYVNREKKLVVAIASLQKQNAKDRIGLIKEHIEPIV